MSKNGKILIGLSIAAFLGPFTQTIYTPSLPEVGHFFHANSFMVNFTISIYTMILAASQFIIGPLSDTRGRRATLLPGLFLFMIGSLICFLATNYLIFLLGRAIQAFGISTGSVVAAAVIGDIFAPSEQGRAMSFYQTMVFLGPVLGPLLGSVIASYYDWKWLFFILISGAIIVSVYNAKTLHETLTKDRTPKKITIQTFKNILFDKSAFPIMLLGFFQFYGYYIYLVFLPSLLDELYQVSLTVKGLFFMPLTAGIVLGTFLGGKVQQYLTHKLILVYTSYGIGIVVSIFWISLWLNALMIPILILLLLAYGILLGMSLPSQSTTLVNLFLNQKGTAIGVYNFIRFTGAAIGPLLGAAFYAMGGNHALYISLFFFLLAAAFVIHKNLEDPFEASKISADF
ncbi:MFS transporter [Bacillus alveayuensis]|jgi:MFS transporter, DHA1 family, multidrug resistance protein|uniref:Multidrug resistance protein n=1 Tax=Aeribacillus alveayuensis TaxID=279215 RepID=A0ABT9VR88_9BACI|nr:MFS transporter [Bacillus alveayuensis]MDQ0163497.1 multidrug resistance protein [Bacillus alveayuensis]